MPAAALKDYNPDLYDALHRGRPLAAQLRSAQQKLARIRPGATFRMVAAQREQVGELASLLRLIADRGGVTGPALEFILEQDHELYRRQGKQPSLDLLAGWVTFYMLWFNADRIYAALAREPIPPAEGGRSLRHVWSVPRERLPLATRHQPEFLPVRGRL